MMRECKRLMKRLYVMDLPENVVGSILENRGRLMLKFAHNEKYGKRADFRTFGEKESDAPNIVTLPEGSWNIDSYIISQRPNH